MAPEDQVPATATPAEAGMNTPPFDNEGAIEKTGGTGGTVVPIRPRPWRPPGPCPFCDPPRCPGCGRPLYGPHYCPGPECPPWGPIYVGDPWPPQPQVWC